MKNKTVLVKERDRAAYCGSSIAAHALQLVHCGGAVVGVKVPQYKPYFRILKYMLLFATFATLSKVDLNKQGLLVIPSSQG